MAGEHVAVIPFPATAPWLQLHCLLRQTVELLEPTSVRPRFMTNGTPAKSKQHGNLWRVVSAWAEIVDDSGASGCTDSNEISRKSQRPRSKGATNCSQASLEAAGHRKYNSNTETGRPSGCLLSQVVSLSHCAALQPPRVLLVTAAPPPPIESDGSADTSISTRSTALDDDLLLRLRADASLDAQLQTGDPRGSHRPRLPASSPLTHKPPPAAMPTRALGDALQRALARSRACRDALHRTATAAQRAGAASCRCRCSACRRPPAADSQDYGSTHVSHSMQRQRRLGLVQAAARAAVSCVQRALDCAVGAFNTHAKRAAQGTALAAPQDGHRHQYGDLEGDFHTASRQPGSCCGLSSGEQAVLHHTAELAAAPCTALDEQQQPEHVGSGTCSGVEARELLAARTAAGLQYAPRAAPSDGAQARTFIRNAGNRDSRAARARLLGARCALAGGQFAHELEIAAQREQLQSCMQRGYTAAGAVDRLMSMSAAGGQHHDMQRMSGAVCSGSAYNGSDAMRAGWKALALLDAQRVQGAGPAWGRFNEYFMGPMYAPAASQ